MSHLKKWQKLKIYSRIRKYGHGFGLKNGINLFCGFDKQIFHCSQTHKNLKIMYFLSLSPKYISYPDLYYLILKLLIKNYGLSDHKMALGVRVLELEDKVGIHCFFTQTLCI